MKRTKSIVAIAKVTIAFFLFLHTVIIRDVKNVRNFIKRRKTSVLMNRSWNILIVIWNIVPEEVVNDFGDI